MKKVGLFVFFVCFLGLTGVLYGVELIETETEIIMSNDLMSVRIWKDKGDIHTVSIKTVRNVLSSPAQFVFKDMKTGYENQQSNGYVYNIDTSTSPTSVTACFDIRFNAPHISYLAHVTYTLDTLAFRWDIEFHPNMDIPHRELHIDLVIPVLDQMEYAFWTADDMPFKIEHPLDKKKTIIYRKRVVLPSIILYNQRSDIGISFVSPFDVKKPGLSFIMEPDETQDIDFLRISNYYLRFGLNRPAQVSVYLVPHDGCWRPGLAWMYDKYPLYFDPDANSVVTDGEGWYYQSHPTIAEPTMIDAANRGVTWEQWHGYFPFYGYYAPDDRKEWALIKNQDTTSFVDWLNFNTPDYQTNSYENDSIKIGWWHDYGVQSYIYFQTSEAWRQFAEYEEGEFYYRGNSYYFGNCIATKNTSGDPHSAWKYCRLMNPDTSGDWGKFSLAQLEYLLERHPTVDGIFYDRDDYCKYDYAHDDGVTMIDTIPVSMFAFPLGEINEIVTDMVHDSGKGIWANGPTSIEVCKGMDGIMSEATYQAPYQQYLGITRPMILLLYDKVPHATEEKLKLALYTGHFPAIIQWPEDSSGFDICKDLEGKYRPLFDLYKGKKWVLYPNVLQLSAGVQGNIFQIDNEESPDPDYLIPLVDLGKSQLIPDPFYYDVWAEISLPNLGGYSYCYLLSGDYEGITELQYDFSGDSIEIDVPAHMVSSLIQLSKDPRYKITRLSSLVQIRGDSGTFAVRVYNFTNNTVWDTVRLITPATWCPNEDFYLRLGPYSSESISVDYEIPDTHPLGKETATRAILYGTGPFWFTTWVVDTVSFQLPELLFVKFAAGDTFPLGVVNNIGEELDISVAGEFIDGSGTVTFIDENGIGVDTAYITLDSLGQTEIQMIVSSNQCNGEIKVTAQRGGHTIAEIVRPVERAMMPTPGDLFFDDFNREDMDGQWDMWNNSDAWSIENGSAKGSGNYSWHFATVGAGDANWTDYRFQVNTKIEGSINPDIPYLKSYIFFRVQNDTQYYRYGIKGDEPRLVLYRRDSTNGWVRLGEYGFQPQQNIWYNLVVEVESISIHCFLNGEQIISVSDTTYRSGGIGIGVLEDNMTVYYDDIVVRPLEPPDTLFADNFDSGAMDTLWNKRQGIWSFPPEEPGFVRGSGNPAHFATVAEACDWTNYRYQVRTRIIGSAIVDWLKSYIFFRVQDDLNYYRFGIHGDAGCIDLYKRVNGIWVFLTSYPFEPEQKVWYNLKVEIQSNQIKGYLGDTNIITYTDNSNPFLNGGIGIGVLEDWMVTDYDDVLVEPLTGQ